MTNWEREPVRPEAEAGWELVPHPTEAAWSRRPGEEAAAVQP